jgi:hypothetical protein
MDDMARLKALVDDAIKAKAPIRDEIDSSGRYLFLQAMEVSTEAEAAAIVWTLGNQSAAAPVFHDLGRLTYRTAKMRPGEAVAVSAHMVVDLCDPHNTQRYKVGLEDIDGISRGRVSALLERELRRLGPVVADVEGEAREGEAKVIMDSLPGPLMGSSGNRPYQIEVIRLSPSRGIKADAGSSFHASKEEWIFRASADSPVEQLVAALPSFVRKLRTAHPQHTIRVRWKHEGETRDLITRAQPGDRAERLLERAMTRAALIADMGFEMPDALTDVEPKLVDRILEVLRQSI